MSVTSGISATRKVERVAHRGSPRERLENTLPSFLLALEHGADAVELDAHVKSDGEALQSEPLFTFSK